MQVIKRFDFARQEWYKPSTIEYEPHPGEGNPVQIGSGPAAVIPVLQEAGSTHLPGSIHCPVPSGWEGWQVRESQKTSPDVSRTVFGVKIMCGLMRPLIPSLPVKAGDFYLAS